MFRFERLDAWQKSIELADTVYSMSRNFPDDERFGLTSQSRRSVVSVSANIAEGSGRSTNRDFCRFIEISYGSLMETVSHMAIAKRREFTTDEQYADFYSQAERVARILSGLRASLQK